jgi:hypothetical protein
VAGIRASRHVVRQKVAPLALAVELVTGEHCVGLDADETVGLFDASFNVRGAEWGAS